MKAERRKTRQSQVRERLWHASLRAEDEAVAHLHSFDPAVAFATACSVEQALAIDWEAEQEEMRRRRDPRKVMEISSTRVRELNVALARLPQGVHPDAAAERHLLQILKDLPPDRAWWVSHKVVRYQDVQFQRSQLSAAVSNVRTCQFLNWNCLKPYAALRLAHGQTTGKPRDESAVVSGENARRSGEICCGRVGRSLAAHARARARQSRLL